jgi:alkylhydroperoxidase/carboxymuconolactone decarboxylase family protein YurZ
MKARAAAILGPTILCLMSVAARADTAYVSDDLILGVYAEKAQGGARLTTLHSGAGVEIVARDGEFAEVRLPNGTQGWVKASFLTTHEPAAVRVKALEEELAKIKSTTPEMAEAAARSELATLRQQLDAKQKELDAAKEQTTDKSAAEDAKPATKRGDSIGVGVIIAVTSLAIGFVAGYAALARRIRNKFGGVKVF